MTHICSIYIMHTDYGVHYNSLTFSITQAKNFNISSKDYAQP